MGELKFRQGAVPQVLGLAILILSAALWTLAQAPNTINTIAGGGTNPTSPTAAYLGFPSSVVRDASNNVYIAAPGLEIVYKVSAGGQLSIYAGTGIAGFSGDGSPANAAKLNFPLGLALDSAGDLYIADAFNNRIRRVDASTGVITTYAGSGDQYNATGFFGGYSGDGGPATSAMMNVPSGLAFDSNGNLFVGDASNEVVREIDNSTEHIITTYAGNGKLGVPGTANGDGGPATSAQLNAYVGELLDVATDASGNLYIADSGDSVIRKVDTSASHIITTYAGSPSHTFTFSGNGGPANEAGLNTPEGLALDASGDLFIADTFNGLVRKVDTTASHIITTVVGGGGECISFATGCGDGGPPASAFLNRPFALFVDAAANLFIGDYGTNTIRVVSPSPSSIISTFAGGGNGGLGGPATSGVLSLPYTIASDSSGNLFFLDRFSINRYDSGSQTLGAYAGNGLEGINIGPGNGDGGPAAQATLFYPSAVGLDSSDNLYVGDDDLWVRRVDAITKAITTYAGTGATCNPSETPGCGDGGPATSATFMGIVGTATDSAGNLYISDARLNRIRRVDVATGIITNYAGTGVRGYSGDGGPATSATLSYPYGLAFDSQDNLYVADTLNNVIRKIDNTPAHNITTYAFNGLPTFGGDGGTALSASMQYPYEVALDARANLFVGGGNDNVVRRIDAVDQSVITVAGDVSNLDGGFSGDGGPSTQALLDNFGVAVDGNENLYIADTGNDRIRSVHLAPVGVVTTSLPASFGPVFAGSSSSSGEVLFGNTGLDDLIVTGISAPAGFVVTNDCNVNLSGAVSVSPSSNQSCPLVLTFSPAAGTPPGTITGNLTFTTNDPANPSLSFPLTGVIGATPGVTLSVSETGAGSGYVISSPSGIDCQGTTGTCSENLPVNAQVTLEAVPTTGNSFAGWTVNASSTTCPGTTALCTITMSAATSVVATFNTGSSSPPPTLTVAAAGNGSGTITSVPAGIDCTITDGTASGTCSFSGFAAGATVVSLRATATAGSKFAGWLTTLCGLLALSDTSGPCQFNLAYASIASPPQVTAVFSGAPQAFTPGQIFVGSYAGTILVYNPNGTLAQVLSSGNLSPNSPIYGMNFDSAGNLYAASPRASGVTDGTVEFFGNDGSGPTTFGTYATGEPSDVLIDPSGNVFTGGGSGTALTISEFAGGQNAAPTSLLYPANESNSGKNGAYIDLLDDNESMLYTAGGNWVGNFDVLYNHQNPDFADNLPGTGAYQIRELSDKSVLVAVTTEVVRLSPTGSVIQTYTPGGSGTFYALALNPDGLSFWTGDGITGTVYQVRISDGAVLDTVSTGLTFAQTGSPTIFGIAVLGSVASGAADVSVTMTGPASSVLQNLHFTYTITVRNNGPSSAANVAVTDPFPSGITVVSAVSSVGACQASATVTCTLGTMTSGQTATITVVATSSLAGTVFNAANATTTTPDPNPANNEATTTTTVLPASTLQIYAPFTGSGTVTDNLGQIDCVDTAGVLTGTCLATYATGTEVTLTGAPSAESVLSGWYPCSGSRTCTVEIGTSPQIVEVFFTPAVSSYTLSVAASGLGNGTITDSFGQINCTSTAGVPSGSCSASYAGGDVVVLTATAGTGSAFGGWSTCAGTGTCAVTMTSNQTVTATFAVAVTLKTITVTPANPTLGVNSTQTFLAIGAYSDGSTQNLTSTVTWSSGTTTVATISTTGFATAVAAGTSTISATSGSVVGSTVLTVVAQPYAYMGSVTSANCCLDVLNTSTNLVVATIPITNFNAPFGITPDQSRIYIADNVNNLLNVVDTTTNTLMTTIPIGVAPTAVAIAPNGLQGYVADLGDNNVPVFNVATNALVTNVSVGFPTATLTASPDGAWVYAASALDNTFAVINTSTNTASSFTVGASTSCVAGPTFNPSGTLAFITEQTSCSTFPPTTTGFLDVVSVPTNSLVAAIPVGIAPIWSVVTPDGARLYVSNTFSNTVSVIDTATNTVIATVPVGTAPQTLAVTPDGTSVYVLNAASNTVSVIEISTNTVTATIPITTPFGIVIAAPPAATAATVLALKPPNLIFNPQVSGTTSGPQTISVTNPGTAPVTLTSIALTGPNVADFPLINSCPPPPATLAAAGTCGLQLAFAPTATGARTAFVTITSTNGLASITQTAPVTGNGTGATAVTFSSLTPSQSIAAGTASISLAGVIGNRTTFPSPGETVSITIDGVRQSAAIGTAGAFSATFATSTIPGSTTPYTITYSYGGDATFTSASDSSTSLTVNALVTHYTLTISDLGTGTGAVTDNTGQINCSEASGVVTGACSGSYTSGTEVILTETPSSPSTFAEWGGACASSGTGTSCTLTITSNLTASANFLPPPVSINLTFPAGVNPPPQQAVFNCPSNPNPSPANPCTDPNAHVLQLQLPQVNSSFTVTVTATEVPPSQADGLCEVGNTVLNDFDCRFSTFFNYGTDANGNTIVPYCYPYANGNCVHYEVYSGTPGNEPDPSLYSGPVNWEIAFNNDTFVPPGPNWTGSQPQFYDDPDYAPTPTSAVGSVCTQPMTINGVAQSYACQFEYDITTFVTPGQQVDTLIGGTTKQLNDVVIAFPPTNSGGQLNVTSTPDAATVNAGQAIGYTITVKNTGPGTENSVTMSDPLPAGTGVSWTISPAYSGPGSCMVSGTVGSQVLSCSFGDLTNGASASVHVSSASSSAGTYTSTAAVTVGNQQFLSFATITVQAETSGFSGLTESPAISFGTASISLSGTISGTGPEYPASGETVSVTINSVTQTATVGAEGAFSLVFPTATIPASATPYVITYSYAGDTNLNATSDSTTTLTINPLVSSFTLSVSDLGTGTGAITDNTGQINCSDASGVVTGTCSASYTGGTVVTLTESATSPTTFGGWGGACATFGTGATCSLTMDASQAATGDFVPPPVSQNLTFPAGTNPPPQQAVFGCPSNPNPTPGNPCTDPNAYAVQLALPQVNGSFTITVTAVEVPPSQYDGLCEVGNTVLNDFDCRFSTFFNYGLDPNGNTIVPLCYPYANGNCVHYEVYSGTPGNEPDPSLYSGPVNWEIAFNNDTFTPPGPYWTGSQPQFYDDPDYAPTPTSAVGSVCTQPMTINGVAQSYACQFEYDITTFVNPGQQVDTLIGGTTKQLNDVVIAFPPTTIGGQLNVTSTPDAATVNAGQGIGYTITVKNAGPGTENSVTMSDPLPAGTGVSWTISPAYSGPGSCMVSGTVGSQVLSCSFGDLTNGASASVHVSSASSSAGTYTSTAAVTVGNQQFLSIAAVMVQAETSGFSGLTGSQTISFGTPSIDLSGVISAPGPLYPPTSETVSVAINGVTQTTPIGADGAFSLVFPTATIPVSSTPYTVTYNYAADGEFAAAVNISTTLTVTKAASTTLISSNIPNPSNTGQAVSIGVMVSGSGTPTGSVQVNASTGESCTATLASGAGTCSITFTTTGPRTLTAAYSGDANFNGSTSAGVSQTVNAAAALKIAPSSIDFGDVYVGLFGVQFVTLTNTGTGPISIKTVAIASSGGASPEFFDLSLCQSSLAANKSCLILLSFIPARDATTVQSATLVITDSAAGSPQSVPLTGTPINPQAWLSTFDLDFASQKVGSTSSPMTVTLENKGTTPLNLKTISINGNFAIASGTTCTDGWTLNPSATCVIKVTFAPKATGPARGSLIINDNALLSPQVVILSGSGD